MNCWHCNADLIWGCDHEIDDYNPAADPEEYCMVTNLSCPNCNAYVEVYMATTKEAS